MPGYADQLSALNDAVSDAASARAGEPADAKDMPLMRKVEPLTFPVTVSWRKAAANLLTFPNPALTDRDLQPAHTDFTGGQHHLTRRHIDPIATATLSTVLLLGFVAVATSILAWMYQPIGTAATVSAPAVTDVLIIVITAWDYLAVTSGHASTATMLALESFAPTLWKPVDPVNDSQPSIHPRQARDSWTITRSSLQLKNDPICPQDRGAHVGLARRAIRDFPEWSTPRQLLAMSYWELSSPDHDDRWLQRSPERRLGLAFAHQAAALDPLNAGARTLVAALTLDALSAELAALPSLSDLTDEEFSALDSTAASSRVDHLVEPLQFSDVMSLDSNPDLTRPMRWRFSQALRTARELSIVVERQWANIYGRRAASGRYTELDRVAVNYQLGRGYLLSASNDPQSDLSRKNCRQALEHLNWAYDAVRSLGSMVVQSTDGAMAFRPVALCVPSPDRVAAWIGVGQQLKEDASSLLAVGSGGGVRDVAVLRLPLLPPAASAGPSS
jgi:hypothetical protein